ncbi:3-hydroxyisobutyrate dehydrogenase [Alteromonas sp. V450]|uniref:3-hydroxyisobutyrate dehydrogenase n=1 Tax=Alteromonas sp. V450 TaxID=1912139 RepID=UPI0008FF09BB|nr:3-hydroxyisobutyrate dehydrogenase [Alteromonas sp. V450]OJF69267.1 3-hydroxyisobutyrate dehydrogenase [Alteromonas sp. V450]
MTTVAFIGLGNMGSGMADNLVKSDYKVLAFDLSEAALTKAKEAGCTIAKSTEQAVSEADIVITMLPAGKHVLDIYSNQILASVQEGTLLIDCSTIDVETAKRVSELAEKKGLQMLDAPVSGGVAAAAGGTLTFMVGGDADAFDKAHGVLSAMGKKIVHAGGHGAGQAAKICNNMLLGATMIATCESFQLAQKLGLDAQVFFDIASNASGQTWSMTTYCPVKGVGPQSSADNDFAGGFASALMLKDLGLAMQGAKGVNAQVPMGELAAKWFEMHCEEGNAGMDFSSIINRLA